MGSIPGQRVKIPHALWPKQTNKQTKTKNNVKQKQYCNKFNKDFTNDPHQKKKIFKKTKRRESRQGPRGEVREVGGGAAGRKSRLALHQPFSLGLTEGRRGIGLLIQTIKGPGLAYICVLHRLGTQSLRGPANLGKATIRKKPSGLPEHPRGSPPSLWRQSVCAWEWNHGRLPGGGTVEAVSWRISIPERQRYTAEQTGA